MAETAQTWQERWRAARRAEFSSVGKLVEALRANGHNIALSTANAWEGIGRTSYPDAYREALAEVNPAFAPLLAELPKRPKAAAAASEKEALTAGLQGLADDVARLGKVVRLLAELQPPAQRNRLLRVLDEDS